MENITGCIICGSSERDVLFKEQKSQIHQIAKCAKCGLMYAYPQAPRILELRQKQDVSPDKYLEKQYVRKQYNQLPDYKNIKLFLNKIKPGRGKLLEIGANVGVFIKFLKTAGWDAIGIDPDKQAVDYAKTHFDINIMPITLEASDFKEETFDAVIMLHVIEHLSNPAGGIKIIYRILKNDGLMVIETPAYDTLMFKIFKHRERSLSCDGHLYFFTLPTLKMLLEKNGFRIIKQEIVGRTLALDRLFWNIGVMSKNKHVKNALNRISQLLRLERFVIHLNMRDMQRVYCLKSAR